MFFLKLVLVLGALALAAALSFRKKSKDDSSYFPFEWKWHGTVAGVIIFVVTLIILGAVGAVPTGHRGIVLRWGAATGKELGQGMYLVTPIADRVELMSVQVKAHVTEAAAASKDLQNVSTKVTLNYAVQPDAAARLFRDVGVHFEQVIIVPAIQEAVKAATAGFDAEKLITDRPLVKDKITDILRARLSTHGILVDALSITDFSFSGEFNQAIESKVTAQQLALKAENDLKRVKFEADQRVAEARGEAEAIRAQAEAIKAQGGAEYVQLKWIEKWNGALPTYMFGGGSNMLLNLPIGK